MITYKITQSLTKFEFYFGATKHKFTFDELRQLDTILANILKDPTDVQINDLFWHEEEFLCELLGIDFNEYENR